MTDEDFEEEQAPGWSTDQLKDVKSCAISLYLMYKAVGAPAAYKEMIAFSAKCLSEKWEMARERVDAALGETMLFLAESEWCHIVINRGGRYTHAANADPAEINDNEALLEFFRQGLVMIPPRKKESKIILP